MAVVTGGAQGIGRAICLDLLARGYRVVALDRDASALRELAMRATTPGQATASGQATRLLTLQADVSLEHEVRAAMDRVVGEFGELTALVNNAGLSCPENPPLAELPYQKWREVLGVNLDGAFLCCKHALPSLSRANGAIVNIASTRALQSEANTEAYAASKGALLALTHAMAISNGPRVRVNAISPGWIDVSALRPGGAAEDLRTVDHVQHPVGRVGRPEDVATLCAYLLSSEAEFITGQNFVLDGGMTRKMIYAE